MENSPHPERSRRIWSQSRLQATSFTRSDQSRCSMTESVYDDLKQLGRAVEPPASPEAAVLDRVRNPQEGLPYLLRFTCPGFTALCPIPPHPDFAHLVLPYLPPPFPPPSTPLTTSP